MTPPIPGWNWPIGFLPCSPAFPIRAPSSAAFAWPATRRSTATIGAACRTRSFSRCLIRNSPTCATGYTKKPTTPPNPPATLPGVGEKLGLPAGIPIAIGEMDVHYGAIGCGVREGTLVKVIGTSTCDCGVVSAEKTVPDIPGICGIVKGAILPGFYGIEAGQSAVGDIFKWWVEVVCEGDSVLHRNSPTRRPHLKPGQSGLLALDWNNGNRTILVDPLLTGLLVGQTLYTTRAEIYRALIEATAFGARAIIERIAEYGVPVERVVCAGGIAEKNALPCRSTRMSPAARCALPAPPKPARSAPPSQPPSSPVPTRIFLRPRRR